MRPLKDSDNGLDTGAGGPSWVWAGGTRSGKHRPGVGLARRATAPGRPPHTQERPGSRAPRARTALPGGCVRHTHKPYTEGQDTSILYPSPLHCHRPHSG